MNDAVLSVVAYDIDAVVGGFTYDKCFGFCLVFINAYATVAGENTM